MRRGSVGVLIVILGVLILFLIGLVYLRGFPSLNQIGSTPNKTEINSFIAPILSPTPENTIKQKQNLLESVEYAIPSGWIKSEPTATGDTVIQTKEYVESEA